jgi:hypothetical protein
VASSPPKFCTTPVIVITIPHDTTSTPIYQLALLNEEDCEGLKSAFEHRCIPFKTLVCNIEQVEASSINEMCSVVWTYYDNVSTMPNFITTRLTLPSDHDVVVCANHPKTSLQTLDFRIADIGSIKVGCSGRKDQSQQDVSSHELQPSSIPIKYKSASIGTKRLSTL